MSPAFLSLSDLHNPVPFGCSHSVSVPACAALTVFDERGADEPGRSLEDFLAREECAVGSS